MNIRKDMNIKKLIYPLVAPTSQSVDSRRQQFILSTLLLAVTGLGLLALIRTTLDAVTYGPIYHGTPPIIMLTIWLSFVGLYLISRRKFFHFAAHILVGFIALVGLYCLYIWGIELPMGLLVITLGIIMSGVLIGTRFSLFYAVSVSGGILILAYLESTGRTHPDISWMAVHGGVGDGILFAVIIAITTIVSWLSNREIERSLARALRSEQALQEERDLLEARVIERTRELEQSQHEKILQLYRFADFGRISSGLLHDIINPLTAVSLNLEQLSTKRRSDLVQQAIEGIKYIEQFVQAARKQIQNPKEQVSFHPYAEVEEISTTLASKMRAHGIRLDNQISRTARLYGSQIKFHQLISNLISNAIDAYEGVKANGKNIQVRLETSGNDSLLQVEDHGQGIPAGEIEKIFEPFYTTKPAEKGTGIGLFIARRIVEEDFQGQIAVTNSKQGTTFTISFPRHK